MISITMRLGILTSKGFYKEEIPEKNRGIVSERVAIVVVVVAVAMEMEMEKAAPWLMTGKHLLEDNLVPMKTGKDSMVKTAAVSVQRKILMRQLYQWMRERSKRRDKRMKKNRQREMRKETTTRKKIGEI